MTSAGPNHVIACPHCGARVFYGTYASISVGLLELPEYSDLLSDWPIREFLYCVECSRCYTRDRATEIDTPDFFSNYDEDEQLERFGVLAFAKSPDEDAIHAAIDRGDFGDDVGVIRRARLQAWHFSNGHMRGRGDLPLRPDRPARDITNIEKLLLLLVDDRDSLVRVELLRQLGRFDEALVALDQAIAAQEGVRGDNACLGRFVDFQRSACARGDCALRMIHDPWEERRQEMLRQHPE